jgi:hypothetical protein
VGHVQAISKKDRILGDLNAYVCLLSSCGFVRIIGRPLMTIEEFINENRSLLS